VEIGLNLARGKNTGVEGDFNTLSCYKNYRIVKKHAII
jgi:hypothetical protein